MNIKWKTRILFSHKKESLTKRSLAKITIKGNRKFSINCRNYISTILPPAAIMDEILIRDVIISFLDSKSDCNCLKT